MTSLFALLNRHSDEDFEELKEAFRKAAEANRKTNAQLDAIIRACAMPRDMREGESHGHTPRLERQPLRPNPTHTFFVTTAAVAVLALVFGGGLLLGDALTESREGAKVAGVMARGPPMIAAAQPPAPTGTTEQEEPPGKIDGAVVPSIAPAPSMATSASERRDVAANTENGPAPTLPGSGDLAKVIEDTRAAIDQRDVKTDTDQLEKSARIEPPDPNQNQDMAGALSTIATVQHAAPTNTTAREEPPGGLEGAVVPSIAPAPSVATGAAERGDVAGNTGNGPPPTLPGSGVDLAKVIEDTRAAIDQRDVKTSIGELEKSEGIERPSQNHNRARSAGIKLSSLEKNNNAPQSSSSDLSDKKHRMKTPDTTSHGKPQSVAIWQIQNHNPSACSSSALCPSKVSPLLGVGF
jgi:hypothetical protein